MARRRRARYTWFPQDPTFYAYGEGDFEAATYYWTNLNLENQQGEAQEVLATPIVPDQTAQDYDTALEDLTLRDYVEGQDYLAKRVVGKVWGSLGQDSESRTLSVILAMGLAVLPVNDETNTPIGGESDYDPLNVANSMNPWMWRRTWILGNLLHPNITHFYPNNLGAYGSVMDGGHVDVKSARRITREQRLFHCCTARILEDQTGAGLNSATVQFGFDLRVLGAMRKHRNRSTFK